MSGTPNRPMRPPNKHWRIVYRHGIGAPDYEMAHGMIEAIVKSHLGGETKFADKVWQRISFMFDVEEEDRGV